jgi:hypothetical protein
MISASAAVRSVGKLKNMLHKGRIRHLLGDRILESFEMKHVVLAFTVALGALAFAQQATPRLAQTGSTERDASAQMVLRSCTRHPGPNRTQSPAPLAFTERDASDLMGPRSCASHNSEFPGCRGDAARA